MDNPTGSTPLSPDRPLERCLVCGSDELYVRKDFPQRLGLLLVVVVGLTSCWFFSRGDLLWALGVLLAVFVVDLAIYWIVPKLTVCYRCGSEFRGQPIHPGHRGFDLATAEKYRGQTSKGQNVKTSKPEGNGPSGLS